MKNADTFKGNPTHSDPAHRSTTMYKVTVSIMLGLLGFAVNFLPVDFLFYGAYRISFLFGLLFPMLITLAWGWKYGLLSALCGGCQTMWGLWWPQSAYGVFVTVPPFTLWIVWHGWFSRTKHNIYIGELIFRFFNTVLLYTLFRWVFAFNAPPANVYMPLSVTNTIVFKEAVNGVLILFVAQGLLYSNTVRAFFKLPKSRTDPRLYYIYTTAVILGGILVFSFIGEKYVWHVWGTEFQSAARILGSGLLLMLGVLCAFAAGNVFAKRKSEDITRAEEELQESQRQLQAVLDNATMHIWAFDGERYAYLSEEWYRFTGQDPALPRTIDRWTEVVHPDDLDKSVETWHKAWNSKAVYDDDFRLRNSGGEYRLFHSHAVPVYDENGELLHYQGHNIDITERVHAEKALAESEERFRQVAESAEEWIWEVDADAVYTYASPIVEKLLGYKPEELVGKKHSYDLFHPDNHEPLKKAAHKIFATKKPLFRFLNRNVHKDGRIVWLSTSGLPILDENGKLLGYRGADIDITERKQAEEDLRKSRERLEELVEQRTRELEDKNKQLERMNKLFVGRELRIKELRDKIKEMEKGR